MHHEASDPPTDRKYLEQLRIVVARHDAAYPMSCAADPEVRAKLNVIARTLGVRTADLLRTAVDIVFHKELSETTIHTGLLLTADHPSKGEISSNGLMLKTREPA